MANCLKLGFHYCRVRPALIDSYERLKIEPGLKQLQRLNDHL
jgi:hypothetical protein